MLVSPLPDVIHQSYTLVTSIQYSPLNIVECSIRVFPQQKLNYAIFAHIQLFFKNVFVWEVKSKNLTNVGSMDTLKWGCSVLAVALHLDSTNHLVTTSSSSVYSIPLTKDAQ